jgi:hypothetical protein
MNDTTYTRSSTSYSVPLMAEAKRTLGLQPEATLDSLLKHIVNGETLQLTREQWWAYGRKFYGEERA